MKWSVMFVARFQNNDLESGRTWMWKLFLRVIGNADNLLEKPVAKVCSALMGAIFVQREVSRSNSLKKAEETHTLAERNNAKHVGMLVLRKSASTQKLLSPMKEM